MREIWLRVRLWWIGAKVERIAWGCAAAWRVIDRRGVCWWLDRASAIAYALDRQRPLGSMF